VKGRQFTDTTDFYAIDYGDEILIGDTILLYTDEDFDYAAAERNYWDKEDMRQHPEDYEDTGEEEKEEIIDEDVRKKMMDSIKQLDADLASGKISKEEYKAKKDLYTDIYLNQTGTIPYHDMYGDDMLDEDFEEYTGEIGDRYEDANNNQFTVRDKVKGGVTLQGQSGEKEVATSDLQFLKKLGESKEVKKEIITEEQVKLARQALNNRGLKEGMSKKEAVQILIKHNIK